MSDSENKWEQRVDAVLGIAASAILVVMMMITTVDVISRYIFNYPLRSAFEVTELLLVVLIFAGLPLVSHADEHVTMDFIDRMLPDPVRLALVRVVHVVCAGVMFFLAWQIWLKAGKISAYSDTTDVIKIPIGPFVYFMSVMIGVTGLIHVFKTFVPGAARASQGSS
jgi:TRAP-type C4-dicarboxylate transport system permease small subunit